jgi:hypothetical protein
MIDETYKLNSTINIRRKVTSNSCQCDECFYCYIHQDYFHTSNLIKLRMADLTINVAEYIGPEMAIRPDNTDKTRLVNIPIKVCKTSHNK